MAIRKKAKPQEVSAQPQAATPQPQPAAAPDVGAQVAATRRMTAEETDAMARTTCIEAGQADPATPAEAQPPVKEAPAPAPAPQVSASVEEDTEREPTTAVARVDNSPTTALGQALQHSSGGAIQGDFGVEDIKFPQLKIVQGSGQLSGIFSTGSVILDQDVLAFPPQDLKDKSQFVALRVIPLRIAKFYRETLSKEEQESGAMPEIVHSKRALMELGGIVGYGPGKWRAGGTQHLLIERPEVLPEKYADTALFDTELDGKMYAPAVYYANGGAYRDFTQALISATRSLLTEPVLGTDGKVQHDEVGRVIKQTILWKYVWTWQLTRKQRGDFWVWSPEAMCKREPIGPEARAYCDEIHSTISGTDVDPLAE